MATRQAEKNNTVAAAKETPEAVAETPNGSPVTEEKYETGQHSQFDTNKQRMPEHLRRYLVKVQGGKLYLPAAYRIAWFRDECPDWGVTTDLIEGGQHAGFATVKANIINPDGRVIATGHKTETRQDFPAGWVEKAETGSIARALALVGFGTQFAPELDDDETGDVPQAAGTSPRGSRPYTSDGDYRANAPISEIWEGPGQCPRCHAPEGKRHGKPCVG